jgi:hypothetical protein
MHDLFDMARGSLDDGLASSGDMLPAPQDNAVSYYAGVTHREMISRGNRQTIRIRVIDPLRHQSRLQIRTFALNEIRSVPVGTLGLLFAADEVS